MIVFNGEPMDPGCYADAGSGWDHVRDVFAGLVASLSPDLEEELQGEQSDDASEEDDALDLLNENTVGGYWAFGENGDGLMLYSDEEDDADVE